MNPTKPISPFRLASLLRLQKDPKLALQLFQNPNPPPKISKKPFRYSLLCYDLIITKLGRAKMFDQMHRIIDQLKAETRFVPREAFFCNVMGFYGRANLPDNARKVFDEMPSFRCHRTMRSFNSLLNVFVMCKEFGKLGELLGEIERCMKPDACTYNILIHQLCENGEVDDAWELFEQMRNRGISPTIVTFVILIHGFCSTLNLKKAFRLKNDMCRIYNVYPNERVYASLMKGLCKLGELSLALRLKEEMVEKKVKLDSAIYSTLISGLYSVGKKEEVSEILEEMKSSGCKFDKVTYNVMINELCKNKNFEEAYKVLDEMVKMGCKPDVISYNMILGALCKDGKWSEANDLFEDMPRRGCTRDVVSYRVLFDGLCEGMQLKEATCLLDEMGFKGFTPHYASRYRFIDKLCAERNDDLLWSALNSLCKQNASDIHLWGMAMTVVFKDVKLSSASELVDNLAI